MSISHQLVSIFTEIDDFCKKLEREVKNKLIGDKGKKRGPTCSLSDSEIMTILILFQKVRYRDFKTFYTTHVLCYWKNYFPKLVSYNRFIELIKKVIFPLTLFIQHSKKNKSGVYYIDSTCLPVCNLKRSKRHKVFNKVAEYGKTSIGLFKGLKLHLVINNHGELIAFSITKGNKHDSTQMEYLFQKLTGLAFGDKGYMSKKISDKLSSLGLKMITKKRKNMKNTNKISDYEKQLLSKRGIIETVIDHLKHHYQIWNTRARSSINSFTHLVSALAAYTIEPMKISAIKQLSAQI